MDLLRTSLVVLALSLPTSARAQGAIFSFVDADGVLHLSNVEEDRQIQARPADAATARRDAPEAPAIDLSPERGSVYRAVVEQAALRYGIDAALLHAVIAVESAFRPNAVSARGAGGLMQLMPETARRYGVADVFDPVANVHAGAQHLADLLTRFDNDLELTLAAYSAGEGAVVKFGRRIPPFRETAAYVPKVIAAYRKFRLAL